MRIVVVLVVVTALFRAEGIEPVAIPPIAGDHPRVFLTAEEAPALRERVERQPWAAAIADAVQKRADALLANPLDIPHAEGQWTHYYSCDTDGAGLQALSPTEHVCPKCQKVYTGWPYDEVYIGNRHTYYVSGLVDLGIAYLVTENEDYARRAREILLEYASFYTDLKPHDRNEKEGKTKARLKAQTLDEAVLLCNISMGYDFVYSAPCFTAEDHESIETGLLRPMIETVQGHPAGISNWQTWHNAGIGSAALALGDTALLDRVFNDPKHGVMYQLDASIMASGMWYEESPSYHWYALRALLFTLESAARNGIPLYDHPKVKKLFDAPLRQVFPDLTFPAMNDSNRSSIKDAKSFYEIGYARYGDTNYLPILVERVGRETDSELPRWQRRADSVFALLWGTDELPMPEGSPEIDLKTSNETSEGLAILRTPDTALYFDYGPGRSGHVHPAKLGLILYAFGDERFVDPGRLSYGNPMHGSWYTTTLAHNTVVVNAKSQKRTKGTLTGWGIHPAFSVVQGKCTDAYPGVTLDRAVVRAGNAILDIYRCTAKESATFDLPLHVRGSIVDAQESTPAGALGADNGYNHLEEVQKFDEALQQVMFDVGDGNRIHVRFLGQSKAFRAKGIGSVPTERVPMILLRQEGTQAVFASVYQLLGPGEEPKTAHAALQLERASVGVSNVTLTVGATTLIGLVDGDTMTTYRVTADGLTKLEL